MVSFLPLQRSAAADLLLVRVHEARNTKILAQVLFSLVAKIAPFQFCNVLFRPLEFELPCHYHPTRYKAAVEAYMAHDHKYDIWMKRSPVHPGVTVVRHGDYTPQKILLRSAFYKRVLQPIGANYAASIVAWRGHTWLATLTVMRTAAQGEFTDRQIAELDALHPHFESVIRRLAGAQESRLVDSSLRHVMSSLPTPSIILDWDLRPLHFTRRDAQLCAKWKQGPRVSALKAPRNLQVPGDILAAIEEMRLLLNRPKKSPPNKTRAPLRIIHPHPHNPALSATLEFLPARALALSKGTFLVTIRENARAPHDPSVTQHLRTLTRRERDCALLAAEGLHNDEIARRLGKSHITVRNQLTSIYRKLGLDNRHKLIAAFAHRKSASGKRSS
jgi:DNA-binding CsgD family transcriptional regulator